MIVGNPPWEKIMSKEDDHLTRLFPGLRGKKQGEFEKQSLLFLSRKALGGLQKGSGTLEAPQERQGVWGR